MFTQVMAPFVSWQRRPPKGYRKLHHPKLEMREKDKFENWLCCLPVATSIGRRAPVNLKQTCRIALYDAVQGSQLYEQGSSELASLKNWENVVKNCELARTPLRSAIDMPLANGQSPLKYLVTSYDHTALRFVQSRLPEGQYSGGIFLGKIESPEPSSFVFDWPCEPSEIRDLCPNGAPFTYRGATKIGHIDGYGVATWADGRIYAGQWTSETMFPMDEPARQTTQLHTQEGQKVQFTYIEPWVGQFAICDESRL